MTRRTLISGIAIPFANPGPEYYRYPIFTKARLSEMMAECSEYIAGYLLAFKDNVRHGRIRQACRSAGILTEVIEIDDLRWDRECRALAPWEI